jgi:hypothetical protein
MKLILILLALLFILIILRLFVVKEGFENTPLNPVTIQGYNNFLTFYNSFCENWKKAIISSVASEIPQQPATDPANPTAGGAPDISEKQMNDYITNLSQTISQPLPPICIPLPTTIDSTNIVEVTKKIPSDVQPFINALKWMNPLLEKSQAHLGSALQGTPPPTENFQDMCQDIGSCLANNPELIQQIAIEISEQNDQQIVQEQEQLMAAVNPFFTNSELSQEFGQNTILVEKAKLIQDQAQSGELMNQINVPGGRTIAKYQLPDGANKLNDMKKNNPDRYNELKQNYSMWTDLKGMIDNINANL